MKPEIASLHHTFHPSVRNGEYKFSPIIARNLDEYQDDEAIPQLYNETKT
jgi:hypothetical protein